MPLVRSNPITTLVLAPLFLTPILLGVAFLERPYYAFAAWVVLGVVFTASYLIGIRHVRRQTWRTIRQRQGPRTQSKHPLRSRR